MERKNLNRGLKPTGRVMLLFMTATFLALFLMTGVSFIRIAHTGMVGEHNLLEMALGNQLGSGVVQSRRGTLLDRNGVVLASQHPSHTLFANHHPDWGTVIDDVAYTAQRLAEVIDMSAEEIAVILSCREVRVYNEDESDYEVWPRFVATFGSAGQRLSFSQKNAILALELPGLGFRDDLTRFYPMGIFAAHTIGYTFFSDEGEIIPGMGLERYFNELLTATDGEFQFPQDRFAILQPGEQRRYITEPLDGHDITLTLDAPIQGFLEEAMDEVVREVDVVSIVGVVMDATTGEILAAGSRPSFDPNERDPEFYHNAIIYPFDPGSTFKIFTYAAAINEGNYQGERTFMSGPRWIDSVSLNDHQLIPRQERTFDEGFFISTNSSAIDLLRTAVTLDRFVEYIRDFGFGQVTNFPLYGEAPGRLPYTGHPINVFTTSYGQGITVTPIQLLQATSAILNDGEMIRPRLVASIYNSNTGEYVYQSEREVVGNPITAETARQVQELMIGVVEHPIGTGRTLYRLDVPSGGKTGTAEIPGFGGFLDNEHIYSYIGFAPADDPEILMFIAVRKQDGGGHRYAGQIYQSVMNNTLIFRGLAGNVITAEDIISPEVERVEVPRVFNLQVEEARAMAEERGLTPIIIGNGIGVFNQSPAANLSIPLGEKLFIQTAMEDLLPDFTGWTRAELLQYQRLLGLDITIDGQGVVVSQSVPPNSVVYEGSSFTVVLE